MGVGSGTKETERHRPRLDGFYAENGGEVQGRNPASGVCSGPTRGCLLKILPLKIADPTPDRGPLESLGPSRRITSFTRRPADVLEMIHGDGGVIGRSVGVRTAGFEPVPGHPVPGRVAAGRRAGAGDEISVRSALRPPPTRLRLAHLGNPPGLDRPARLSAAQGTARTQTFKRRRARKEWKARGCGKGGKSVVARTAAPGRHLAGRPHLPDLVTHPRVHTASQPGPATSPRATRLSIQQALRTTPSPPTLGPTASPPPPPNSPSTPAPSQPAPRTPCGPRPRSRTASRHAPS